MANAAVSLSATNITINLGTEWGRRTRDALPDRLVIIFSDVQAGTTAVTSATCSRAALVLGAATSDC